jgi:hypothetical protein
MSFLNKAGTIVIDATLTDTGRKYMADGNFTIAKFALGDDEIDYSLMSTEIDGHAGTPTLINASTTPLFEAFSQQNANINYGLMDHERKDLLYIPILKINDKLENSALPQTGALEPAHTKGGEIYYLSVNDETTSKLKDSIGWQSAHILESNVSEKTKLIIESGIDLSPTGSYNTSAGTPDPISGKRTAADREAFILQTELLDSAVYIYCDNRFFTSVLIPAGESKFSSARGSSKVNFETLNPATSISEPRYIENFSTFYAPTIDNLVYETGTNSSDLDISVVCGPRGSALAINLVVDNMLTSKSTGTTNYKYSAYGTSNTSLLGGSNKFDYIDTALYIEGATTSARLMIPIRIIRYAGT